MLSAFYQSSLRPGAVLTNFFLFFDIIRTFWRTKKEMKNILSSTWTTAKSVVVLAWNFSKHLLSLCFHLIVAIFAALLFLVTLGKINAFRKGGEMGINKPQEGQ
jgi:uncharacterized membrane protein